MLAWITSNCKNWTLAFPANSVFKFSEGGCNFCSIHLGAAFRNQTLGNSLDHTAWDHRWKYLLTLVRLHAKCSYDLAACMLGLVNIKYSILLSVIYAFLLHSSAWFICLGAANYKTATECRAGLETGFWNSSNPCLSFYILCKKGSKES